MTGEHDYVSGPIPCEGCASNIVRGMVYKLDDMTFICESCYEKSHEMCVQPKDGHEQYDEYDD